MNINVIEFKNVTKTYKLFKNDKMRLISTLFKIKNYKEKHAVNNVSFNIKKGESVAIFGRNGAGNDNRSVLSNRWRNFSERKSKRVTRAYFRI